jgi:hypothetical protein
MWDDNKFYPIENIRKFDNHDYADIEFLTDEEE